MADSATKRPLASRNRETQRVRAFLEELGWLITSYSNVDLKLAADLLIERADQSTSAARSAVGSYASSNPNKHFLVGALPRVLTDETLFPTNEDIAEFARSVMDLTIQRYDKKSKYEIIGHIVCETDRLDDRKLAKLVSALATLTEGGDKTRTLIRQRKAQNFEWNEIIQELANTTRHV
jgi:hypothetical protein